MAVVEAPLQTPDTAADIGQGQPDPRALAVAQEIQSRLPEADGILFGSRATGTWRPRSDIDLALVGISPDTDAMLALKDQARGVAKTEYTDRPPHIQITLIPRTDFEAHRTSFPHIAGQVQFRGLTPTGERLPALPQDNPWPGVQEKLQAVQSHLMRSLRALGAGDPADALFHAQEALEFCLKAALGANRLPFDKHHDLEGFAADLSEVRSEWMEGMLPPAQLLELSKFREQAIYGGRSKKWPSNDPEEIVEAVQRICGELASHILKHLGKSPRDVKYEHWLSNEPLGGMEATPIPARANAKSGSGQGGGQNPGSASDAVAQQPDGHILAGMLLKRAQPVQCGPAQDAHHGGGVSRAHAAVVLANCTSRVRCRPFSTPQWPRTRPGRACASTGRLAM